MEKRKKRILIVEDEKNMSRFIEREMQHEGYETGVAFDGREGLEKGLNENWSLILLDLMLPKLSGLEVCRRIRSEKDTPIIMLTARDSVIDRVSGLDQGADDYIVKPFEIEELLARIRSLLRRVEFDEDVRYSQFSRLRFRDLIIEKESRVVHRGDELIELTKREYELLMTLMQNVNVVLSRKELLEKVWGYKMSVETNVVDVYIRYLRNKIDEPNEPSYIQTVRGAGYVMREDNER